VVNVTWRGKTFVGTLMDSTRLHWASPRQIFSHKKINIIYCRRRRISTSTTTVNNNHKLRLSLVTLHSGRRRSLTSELSLSNARRAADG